MANTPRLPWSEAELDLLRTGASTHEFLSRYPDTRTMNAIRLKRADLGLPRESKTEAENRVQGKDEVDPPLDARELLTAAEPTVRDIFKATYRASSVYRQLNPSLHKIERPVGDGLPIGIAFIGDMHIGADFVDTDWIERDMATIRATAGMYAVGMGDYVEGITKDSKAIGALVAAIGAIGNRDVQDERAVQVLSVLADRLLLMIDGNHDSWLAKVTGSNHTQKIAGELAVPYFRESGGSAYLMVGDVRYHVAVKHTYRGNSRINTTNPQRTMFGDWPEWDNCDVICLGHLHYNDMHQQTRKGGVATYFRSGTWKIHDSYSLDLGYKPEWGIPVAVLYPNERRVVAFRGDNFREAIRFLAAEREHYQKEM